MMEYACRSSSVTSVTDSLTTGISQTSSTSTLISQTSKSTSPGHPSSVINGATPVSSGEALPSNDLLLALALLQGDTSSLENRGMELTPLQKLLLQQLSSRPASNKAGKSSQLWSGIGIAPSPAPVGQVKPLLSFLDPVTIALNTAQPKDRAGHGRRGRPLGSVGRRKLLENNQEALTAELRCELTKPLTPETEARIEMIKHKLQENEARLRKLNESKSTVSRSGAGEKRDRATANSCSVSIAPKPSEGRSGLNYPAVVESPCKQLKLEEKKIEPMINLVASSSYSASPSSVASQIGTSATSVTSSPTEPRLSMVPRISLANLSPPKQQISPLNNLTMMSTPQGSSFASPTSSTFLTPPSSTLLTPPSSSLLTPPSRLFAPLASSISSSPSSFPSHPPFNGGSLITPPLLQPTINYGTAQRSLLEQIVGSITAPQQRRLDSTSLLLNRNQEAALTLLNRQKLMESCQPSLKCLTCCSEINPSVSIFPFMCVKCTLKKVFPE